LIAEVSIMHVFTKVYYYRALYTHKLFPLHKFQSQDIILYVMVNRVVNPVGGVHHAGELKSCEVGQPGQDDFIQ